MKKIVLAIALVMTMAMGANAQRDGFFSNYNSGDRANGDMPAVPNTEIGNTGNVSAPLGSGLLILTALGAGYAIRKKENR